MAGRGKFTPRQKKSLGQVFLRTDWPVQRVVERMRSWKVRRVIEIGPGGGILTRALLAADLKVTAIEKDDRFADTLIEYDRLREDDQPGILEVVNQDVLKYDLAAWLGSSGEPAAVIGNIPYNISSPILLWALPYLNSLKGIDFLTQLEFAQRLASSVGSKSYGSLSVYTQLRAKVELECKVDRTCFSPVPNVDSALVSLMPRQDVIDPKLAKNVEQVTRAAFNQRRKKLRNSMKVFLTDSIDVDQCPVDLTRRPDSLRPDEFVAMAQFFLPE